MIVEKVTMGPFAGPGISPRGRPRSAAGPCWGGRFAGRSAPRTCGRSRRPGSASPDRRPAPPAPRGSAGCCGYRRRSAESLPSGLSRRRPAKATWSSRVITRGVRPVRSANGAPVCRLRSASVVISSSIPASASIRASVRARSTPAFTSGAARLRPEALLGVTHEEDDALGARRRNGEHAGKQHRQQRPQGSRLPHLLLPVPRMPSGASARTVAGVMRCISRRKP